VSLVAATLGIWWGHSLYFAARDLRNGTAAWDRGEMELARLHWESAASRPAPGNGYARRAMDRLIRLEEALEAEGRSAEALRLCFSIGGIAHATEGYWSWYAPERNFAEGRIPALAEILGVSLSPDRYTLYRPVRHGAAHAAILGFAGFVAAAWAAIGAGDARKRRAWSALALLLLAAWLLLLRAA